MRPLNRSIMPLVLGGAWAGQPVLYAQLQAKLVELMVATGFALAAGNGGP